MAREIIYAALAGIVPALIWLAFWLREDRKNPEPKGLEMRTFLFGMLAVLLVIPLQKGAATFIPSVLWIQIVIWALLEEGVKFGAAYFGGMHTLADNEPMDPLIYMITAALGFVALENTLFILGPILGQDILGGIVTSNMRFIGASLLHVVSSGIVGAFISLSFYKTRRTKYKRTYQGLILAIIFHSAFNLLILSGGGMGLNIAFVCVWIGVIALLWLCERIKGVKPIALGEPSSI